MARHKKTLGICKLCGTNGELTYEHVPPRCTFNKKTKYVIVDFLNHVQNDNFLNENPKGKIKQGGIGYNSFCSKCNSFLGSNYVNAYKEWVNCGKFIIDNSNSFNVARYQIKNQEPNKILKSIISMFLAINPDWYLESYPELSDFVNNPEQIELDKRFKIFSYLTTDGGSRYFPHATAYIPNLGGTLNCSEIAFPPYGYLLTIDFENKINILNDITNFKNYSELTNMSLTMFNLQVHSPFPIDYRNKIEIQNAIDKGLEIKKQNAEKQNANTVYN
jgi:hypothetical protein